MTDHERVLHTLTPRMQECMHTLRWMHHAAGVHISTMHGNGSTFCVHAECMRRTTVAQRADGMHASTVYRTSLP